MKKRLVNAFLIIVSVSAVFTGTVIIAHEVINVAPATVIPQPSPRPPAR